MEKVNEVKAKFVALDTKVKAALAVALVLVVALVTYFVWPAGCISVKTCAELKGDSSGKGWPVGPDPTVCGESHIGLGPDGSDQCYGGVNPESENTVASDRDYSPGWEHANRVCSDAGARLCTVQELLNEATRGTGCQHDAEMTWSSETRSDCDDGHIVVQGGQHRGEEACPDECAGVGWQSGGNADGANCATCQCTPRCAPDSMTYAVRCCGDVNATAAKIKCDNYQGYKGPLKPPPPRYEAADVDPPSRPKMCSVASCESLQGQYGGWPLEAINENFDLDRNREHPLVCGESDNGMGPMNPTTGKYTDGCSGGTRGGASTTFSSWDCNGIVDNSDGGVDRRISGWAEAQQICERIGARLCTVDELLDEVTKNTGCMHDGEWVWSSQTTSPTRQNGCNSNQHIVAPGAGNIAYQVCPEECSQHHGCSDSSYGGDDLGDQAASRDPNACKCTPKCSSNGNSHAVRCCADAEPWVPSSSDTLVNLVAGLPHGNCHFHPCAHPTEHEESCAIVTPNALGGGHSGDNGIRVCGKTSQSTVGWGGEPGRAIDGKKCSDWGDGSCTHTDDGSNGDGGEGEAFNQDGSSHGLAWWSVDLGGRADIDHVRLWHRTGCGSGEDGHAETAGGSCNKRLEGAYVYVTDEPLCIGHIEQKPGDCAFDTVNSDKRFCSEQNKRNCILGTVQASISNPEYINDPDPPSNQCRLVPNAQPGQECALVTPSTPHVSGVTGRYVTIAHHRDNGGGTSNGAVLTICEVSVWGYKVANLNGGSAGYGNDCRDRENSPDVPYYSGALSHTSALSPASCASRKSCQQLESMYGGWPLETSFNSMEHVCGESDNGLGGCGINQCFGGVVQGGQDLGAGAIEAVHETTATGGWPHADKICRQAGARLCTVAEIQAEVTRGTGCQHDGEMVWSSDDGSAAGGCEGGHVIVQGGQHRGDEACPDECAGKGEASGSCVGTDGYCEVDLTKGLYSDSPCHWMYPGDPAFTSGMAPSSSFADNSEWECASGDCDRIGSYNWKGTQGPNGVRVCGMASSSSVGWGGEPSLAIDRDTSGAYNQRSCSHTDNPINSDRQRWEHEGGVNWFQIDLGQPSLVNHVDLWHRTDCCQDRLQTARVILSDSPVFTRTGVDPTSNARDCGTLSHSAQPEKTVCGYAMGPAQYVTVAHQGTDGGGEGIVSICEMKVWGVKGTVDPARCSCTPRCAPDTMNYAVRCCADEHPLEVDCSHIAKYSGKLLPAVIEPSTWFYWVLAVFVIGVLAAVLYILRDQVCGAFHEIFGKRTKTSLINDTTGYIGGSGPATAAVSSDTPSNSDSIYA